MAEKDVKMNRIISNFAGRTSMHGLGSLSSAHSRKAKTFWSLVCLSSMGMFCFMLSRIVRKYLEFGVIVNVQEVGLCAPRIISGAKTVPLCGVEPFFLNNHVSEKNSSTL